MNASMTRGLPSPLRLLTAEEVEAYLRRYPSHAVDGWVEFAVRHGSQVRKPPVMSRIPQSVEMELTDTRIVIEQWEEGRELPETFDKATGDLAGFKWLVERATGHFELPAEYPSFTSQVTKAARQSGLIAKQETAEQAGRCQAGVIAHLEDLFDFHETLAKVFYRYLHAKNKAAKELVRDALVASLFYENQVLDRQTLAAVAVLPDNATALLLIVERLCEELLRRRSAIFRPFLSKHLQATKERVKAMHRAEGLPMNRAVNEFKRGLISLFNQIECEPGAIDDLDRSVLSMEMCCERFRARVGDRMADQARHITANYSRRVRLFQEFFDKELHVGSINRCCKAFRGVYGYGRRTGRAALMELHRRTAYVLHPCKDLLEYRKGRVSRDCTARGDLAAQHLLHERFFNVRILQVREKKEARLDGELSSRWVGNVYCLDFTDRSLKDHPGRGVIIIDRIQVSRPEKDFRWSFSDFMESLSARMFAGLGVVVLGPSSARISNHPAVRDSYKAYCQKLVPVSAGYLFSRDDRCFESASSTRFYLLSDCPEDHAEESCAIEQQEK